jgi:NDP-sugar pyrophosphorylase family protein
MKALTQVLPKALVQVAGKTLLELSIKRLQMANVQSITIAVGWKSDMIREAITQFENSLDVQIVEVPNYEIGPLQTLTTALNTLEDEDVIICPVDLLISSDAINTIITHHSENKQASVTLAVDPHANSGSAVSVDSLGHILGVQRDIGSAESVVRSAMFMVISPNFIEYCRIALNNGSTKAVSVLNHMIEQGLLIQSSVVSERWFDIDTISEVLQANRSLLESTKIQHHGAIFVPAGDTMEIGDMLSMESGIKLGKGVSLNGPCLIRGYAEIGENSIIGPYVSLDTGAKVGDHCEIQNAVIIAPSKICNNSRVNDTVMYESESFRMEE